MPGCRPGSSAGDEDGEEEQDAGGVGDVGDAAAPEPVILLGRGRPG